MSRFSQDNLPDFMKNLLSNFLGFLKAKQTEKYLYAAIATAVGTILLSVLSLNTCIEVSVDGRTIGYIGSQSNFDLAYAEALKNESAENNMAIIGVYNDLKAETTHALFAPKMSIEELADTIDENVEWLTNGTVININNGEYQFTVATEAEGQKVLDTLYAESTVSDANVVIKSIGFLEDVKLENTNVRIAQLESADDILATIKAGKEAVQIHSVVEGESLWSIARSNGLTVDGLKALNPQLKTERLQIGQELQLSKLEPLLNVVVTKEVTAEEAIAYETQVEESAELLRGEKEVKTQGQEGKKLVTYTVTESNGIALEKEVVNEVVILEPVTEVVTEGTSTLMVASRSGSGALNWPIRGRINSPYGARSRGFHTGLDIDANTGDSVKAAAGGRVVTAGWEGGYGYCVVIDHGNGLKTRYAHLSKVGCTVGQTVLRGEEIGKAGSTGNSTGPHVHFEVIVNGDTQNPMSYLG